MTPGQTIRVLLADDHAAVREALAVLINSQPDMQVVAQAGDGREAVARARQVRPDIAVLDLSMPAMSGLEATAALKDAIHGMRIIVLTRLGDYKYVQELLRLGASGYVLKQSASEELLRAVRAVSSGRNYLDPLAASNMANRYAVATQTRSRGRATDELSSRESEVLRLLARGYANREIASELEISVKTVEAHKANAMGKLGMTSRIEIVRFAILQGWLRESP